MSTVAPTDTAPTPIEKDALGHSRAHRSRPQWRLVVVGLVLACAFGLLLAKGLGGALDYFETVDQAWAHKASFATSTFRLEGVVVAGTVQRTSDGVRFVAAGNKHRIVVVNHGNPPQLFQPNVPVVVVGHFESDTFVSNQIIIDHSSTYIEHHPGRVRAPDGTSR